MDIWTRNSNTWTTKGWYMESMAFPGSIFRDIFFLSQGVHCGDEYALFFDIDLYSLCLMRVKFKNIFRSIRVWHNLWKISESVMTDKIKYQTVIDTWNFLIFFLLGSF